MIRLLQLFLVVVILSTTPHSKAYDGIGIVAVVGDELISSADVQERLKLAILSSGLQGQPGVQQRMLPQIVQLLIDEALVAQQAQELNITISEAEIDKALISLQTKNRMSEKEFDTHLRENGISNDVLRDQLKAQILQSRVISRKVQPLVNVTEHELQEAMEYIANDSGLGELHISQIVLPIDSPSDEPQVRALAFDLIEQISDGASFESLAREFSRSTDAASGGSLGWIQEDQLSSALVSSTKSLAVGEVSAPIRLDDSYVIIRLDDRRALIVSDTGETEVGLKQVFVPFEEGLNSEQKQKKFVALSKHASQFKGCSQFKAFADKVGSTLSPEMGMMQLKSLNNAIRKEVSATKVGQLTPIIRSEAGLRMFAVCEKTKATPSLADRNALEESIMRQKLQLRARQFMQDLRRNTFIEIRL